MKSIDRPRAGHRRAARQADEAALADRRVAQPLGAVQVVQPGRGVEVAAALADPFAHHEDAAGCAAISSASASSVACDEGDFARSLPAATPA